jgi:hypothetical protein
MNTDIHRLLDEAFAGVDMTPDARDLKEEMRGNLVARVAELEIAGRPAADAARQAIAELGDIHELLDGPADRAESPLSAEAAYLRHRVRPRPGFVVRTVLLALLAATALVLFVLAAVGVLDVGLAGLLAVGAVVALPLGFVTGDALRQETTTNHPMPPGRAAAFGVATGALLAALALGAAFATHLDGVWLVVVAALLFVGAIALFGWLGATHTNRHKAWTRLAHPQMPPNRFEREPETAARFGMYTAVIWLVTFAVIAVLVLTVGWWWAPLAFVAGFAAMMLTLARMMFGPRRD